MADNVYLGIGTNLGDLYENIVTAVEHINNIAETKILARSKIYRTEPIGVENHPDYLNCAVKIATGLYPHDFFTECMRIENAMGRHSKGDMKPRTIDIDLLLYDAVVLDEDGLVIPHPGIKERAFVLQPLIDLDPDLRCPLDGESYLEILKRIVVNQKIEPFAGGQDYQQI